MRHAYSRKEKFCEVVPKVEFNLVDHYSLA